ncbi:MAG: hypothetical protein DDT33_01509 [Firmicutes bacterium]|nr:hypothetical protein [Bacillota bacterium]
MMHCENLSARDDILLSPHEIFAITALEALTCGTPVIVIDRCGIADVINGQAACYSLRRSKSKGVPNVY